MDARPFSSADSEVAVLGGMLLGQSGIDDARSVLRADAFALEAHRLLFSAILAVADSGAAVDVLTLSEHLQATGTLDDVGGFDYLAALVDAVPTAANLEWHARTVRELHRLRRLREACQETLAALHRPDGRPVADLVSEAEARLLSLDIADGREPRPLAQAVRDGLTRLAERQAGRGVLGTPTGYTGLDRATGGLNGGDLAVVASRPSMGKTAFVMSVARNMAAATGRTSLVHSLEQSEAEIVDRCIAAEARVDLLRLRSGRLGQEDLARVDRVRADLERIPMVIDDRPAATIHDVRARARRLARRHGVGVVVVDYLQLMSGTGHNRVQDVSEMSRGLKLLARELDVPVIAVSQLSRGPEQRTDKRPMLSDLRESGAIEQDADVVAFLYREEYYATTDAQKLAKKGMAELIVAKSRNGPTGMVPLHFDAPSARFDSVQGPRRSA